MAMRGTGGGSRIDGKSNEGEYVILRSVELFAGAGGLAMGISKAGFEPVAVVEWDRDTCVTIRGNQARGVEPVAHWPLVEGDVRNFDYSTLPDDIDFLAGGPPCQPFSLGGKHRGDRDHRDMFPEAVRGVRELSPRAFLFENVKGLLRENFASYFQYITLQLTYPDLTRRDEESWQDHLAHLERHHTVGYSNGLTYRVVARLLNAADYGVPQRRERVVIVGFREDIGIEWSFPKPTHSQDALFWDKWVTGDYWERRGIARKDRSELAARFMGRVERLRGTLLTPGDKPWRTVRDVIGDLPAPRLDGQADGILNHRLVPGARSYPGHTGSPMDEPAKTLKAGDHGVPGGENTLAYADGSVRYFSVRESARLQTFPDDYTFPVSWTESMRQLGNAVPTDLGYVIARSIQERLTESGTRA